MNIVELTALVLIFNGTAPRFTTNIKNVLGIYRDRLPDSIYSNMIIVLTNCEDNSVNLNPADVGLSEQCSVFHMQNSAFSSNPKTWSYSTFTFIQHDFNLSMQKMNSFFKKLLSLQPTSTKLFKDMSDDRNRIQQQLYQARMTILDLQNTEDALAALEISAGIHAVNAEKSIKFVRERKVEQTKKITTDYYNNRCCTCDMTCHKNCSPHEGGQRGWKGYNQCSVMDIQGFCQICPGHCYINKHIQVRYITEKVTTSVNDIDPSMQQQYLQAKQGLKDADSKCNDLQTSKKLLQDALQQQYQDVRESISKLQQTCKDSNITAILFQFIELLERDAVNLKSPSAIANSNKFIVNLKQLCDVSGQLNDTQQVMSLQPTNKSVQSKSTSYTKAIGNDNSLASNETNVQDLLYRQNTVEFSSPTSVYPQLSMGQQRRSITNDDYNIDNELYYNLYGHNHNADGEEKKDEFKVTNHEGNLKQEQTMMNEGLNFKLELSKENLAMLSLNKLLKLLNKAGDNPADSDIKNELQKRCSGESIGFLTIGEQIILCDQYTKHQQMKFKELVRLSVQLEDEINVVTGGDPLKINLIPVEKRLQLAALNLLIRKKD